MADAKKFAVLAEPIAQPPDGQSKPMLELKVFAKPIARAPDGQSKPMLELKRMPDSLLFLRTPLPNSMGSLHANAGTLRETH
eukprot:566188-Pelagomonas_calceolata.AAC.6